MHELKIDVEDAAGGIRIFRLTGPLILNTLFEFQDMARSNVNSSVVIELSGVPYMDSAGLGAILGIMAHCHRTGNGFGTTGVGERLRTLFKVTGVDGMIPTFDSVTMAESKLSKAAPA